MTSRTTSADSGPKPGGGRAGLPRHEFQLQQVGLPGGEIEQRIQGAEVNDEHSVALPDRPTGIPASFDEHTKLMLDLQLLAFQTDTTRVFSLILAREVSNRSYPQIGVPDQHHPVSHHRDDPGLIEKKTKIDAPANDLDSALDAASVSMVRRASPVPAPPPELGTRVNLKVPVCFQ